MAEDQEFKLLKVYIWKKKWNILPDVYLAGVECQQIEKTEENEDDEYEHDKNYSQNIYDKDVDYDENIDQEELDGILEHT